MFLGSQGEGAGEREESKEEVSGGAVCWCCAFVVDVDLVVIMFECVVE